MANFPALGMRPHPLAVRLCKHRHGRPQKFFQGWAKWTFCLSFSGCRRYNANGRSHNALPFLHHKENPPCYGNSPKNGLLWQQCFFSHRVNYITANSSHCMATLPATDVCVQQPHAAKRLLPNCCCFAIKVNFSTIGSRVLQFASAGKRADLVSCKLITAWYQNSLPDSCAVWMSYWQIKRPLQELSQLSCWLQVFYKFLVVRVRVDDRRGLSPILCDTAPLFVHTDQLLCHCILICSNVH